MAGDAPIAGKEFPWALVERYYLRLTHLSPFARLEGDRVVGRGVLGAYGLAEVELPNPDVDQRLVSLPIEHKDDFRAISLLQLDRGVQSGENEVVIVVIRKRGLVSRKPSFYLAVYPSGTWQAYFQAVAEYKSQEFRWPEPLLLVAPDSHLAPFPSTANILRL